MGTGARGLSSASSPLRGSKSPLAKTRRPGQTRALANALPSASSSPALPSFSLDRLARGPSGVRGMSVRAAAAQAEVAQAQPMSKAAHGFTLVQEEFITEYGSQVGLYRHDKTGAQVMSVVNSDENKTFGVTFRTPVSNSRGTPHILEHSVLCGSRKYPIKEPFVELIKGSLNTFLNAFTYPDRTCYPVASANLRDFYNLIDVYLDATLHPNCIRDPQIFAQEGWHLELEEPSQPLTYKGVVFNEMKGVYSSPDSVNGRVTQNVLFPDTSYAKDSGGDPADIPDLTFDEFKAFYESYYHPSNARFWFYGDDPADERLRLLSAYLDEFEAREVDSTVHLQKLWDQPKKVVEKYAVGEADESMDEEPKSFVSLNWLLTEEPLDLETELGLGFLNYLMLGTSASPLRKALTDSGLGESLIGGGVEDELCQPIFSIGLKGVKQEDADKVEALVMETLERLEKEGFAASAIEAAINTIEFSLRENNTGRFPRGLSLMLRAMSGWIYDRDPFRPMKWHDDLSAFKARLESGEDVFSPLIRKFLIDNNHRVTVELNPDERLGKELEDAEKARLERERQTIGEEGISGVIDATRVLKEKQETPDAPEALSCVPSLSVADIPKTVTPVPTTVSTSASGVTTLSHEIFTNDVVYLDVAFDLKTVPQELIHLVPLFCRSLTQMGTDKESFIELTERIGRKTGGISVSPFVSAVKGTDEPIGYIMVRGKTMADKSQDMLDIVRDVLLSAKLDDKDRFKQMVLETRSSLEAGIIGSGHSFAGTRLDAQFGVAGWIGEEMGGVSYLERIRALVSRVESDWEGVMRDLETIRNAVLQQKGAMVNLTGDEGALTAADKSLNDFWASIAPTSVDQVAWNLTLPRQNAALTVPTQVNYVAKAGNLYDTGYKLSGSSYVVNKHLGVSWLWDRVRVSGGAYGGFCDFDVHSGVFSYMSYRDPNLLTTCDVYDGTVDFLRKLDLTEEELQKSIVGTIGDIDSYQLPDSKGRTAFMRHLLGIDEATRQQRRDEVLGTTLKDFHEFAEVLNAVKTNGQVVAVTSPEKAELANKERPGFFQEVKRIV